MRYGGPDETPVDPAEFAAARRRCSWSATSTASRSRPAGCAATADGEVEIKRMYVVPQARGQGPVAGDAGRAGGPRARAWVRLGSSSRPASASRRRSGSTRSSGYAADRRASATTRDAPLSRQLREDAVTLAVAASTDARLAGDLAGLEAGGADVHALAGAAADAARTGWMFGLKRRRVRRCECDTLMPNPGPLPHTSHTEATATG